MEQLKPLFAPLQRLLDLGGVRKDIACIVISALALVLSFCAPGLFPVDAAWVAIVLCGLPIVCEAFIALVTEFDVKADLLVSIALIASIVVGENFAAGEVALIMQLGGLLEELTVARAQRGIERLVALTPRTARLVGADGGEREVAAESVEVGQTVRVLPGETVPVDGMVVSGVTSVDESVVTGESMPADKQEGDEVSSGTVNQFGAIEVRATRAGDDGTLQRMARLVQSADAGKAKIVRLADRWATWVVVGALVSAVGVWLVTGEILRAVTVLVVFCPCSLVLATPTALVAAIGNATKHGFLVKEGDALERLAQVRQVVFDKTGTLTEGRPQVVGLVARQGSGLDRPGLYALLAGAEARSEHPLGRAVVACARAEGVVVPEPDAFAMVPGRGVSAQVAGRAVMAGSRAMMEEAGLAASDWDGLGVEGFLDEGCTVVYVAVDGQAAGVAALADTVRPESAATVASLDGLGVNTVLLTGDGEAAAALVARQVGVWMYEASQRPEDKLRYIEEREAMGQPSAMVGDGVNDAPALRRAFVGIAVGGVGSDIAVEAADIAIVDKGVGELPHLLALARHAMAVIKANLTFAMTLNFVAIVLAFVAVLDPVSGALVHNCGSVAVIINSALLLGWQRK